MPLGIRSKWGLTVASLKPSPQKDFEGCCLCPGGYAVGREGLLLTMRTARALFALMRGAKDLELGNVRRSKEGSCRDPWPLTNLYKWKCSP